MKKFIDLVLKLDGDFKDSKDGSNLTFKTPYARMMWWECTHTLTVNGKAGSKIKTTVRSLVITNKSNPQAANLQQTIFRQTVLQTVPLVNRQSRPI